MRGRPSTRVAWLGVSMTLVSGILLESLLTMFTWVATVGLGLLAIVLVQRGVLESPVSILSGSRIRPWLGSGWLVLVLIKAFAGKGLMELFGWRAWLVLGIAIAGWALVVLLFLTGISLVSTNHALFLSLYECEYNYHNLVVNYTRLAGMTLSLLNQTITTINATSMIVGYNTMVLNETINELNHLNNTLYSVNNTLTLNNYLLHELIRAVNGSG